MAGVHQNKGWKAVYRARTPDSQSAAEVDAWKPSRGWEQTEQLPQYVPVGPGRPHVTVLLVWIVGVIGHELCVAWSFVVFFGHKYDLILP